MNAAVIAVDGPSGVGKGTLCAFLARRLGWHLLDSGSLYRLTALQAERCGVSLEDATAVAALARELPAEFDVLPDGGLRVRLAGEVVDAAIRTETCGAGASRVAALPAVRAALFQRQRDFLQPPGLVADGRDMGTVIFPEAGLKLFLGASAEARAQRRLKQLREKGIDANLAGLSRDIAERDARDAGREAAPLRAAPDAVVMDTTGMGILEVQEAAMRLVAERLGLRP